MAFRQPPTRELALPGEAFRRPLARSLARVGMAFRQPPPRVLALPGAAFRRPLARSLALAGAVFRRPLPGGVAVEKFLFRSPAAARSTPRAAPPSFGTAAPGPWTELWRRHPAAIQERRTADRDLHYKPRGGSRSDRRR